jgi:hypothetical protein
MQGPLRLSREEMPPGLDAGFRFSIRECDNAQMKARFSQWTRSGAQTVHKMASLGRWHHEEKA